MPLQIEDLPDLYSTWRARYDDRDYRMDIMQSVVRGDFSIFDPDEEKVESRSPNFIQVALEDTAEAASLVPSVRVQPTKEGENPKKEAQKMEKIAMGYFDVNEVDLMIPQAVMDMGAYGMAVWTITPDMDEGYVRWARRDATTCYPEPDYRPGNFNPSRVLFVRELHFSQLPERWKEKILEFSNMSDPMLVDETRENIEITADTTVQLVEYYDKDEIVIAGLLSGGSNLIAGIGSGEVTYYPVELQRTEHGLGVCPVVIGSRITLDGEFRGQYDQVVDLLEAHIRLMGMVIDYADQSVYSDIWVRDLIGEMPWGGGAYIELGPNGAIGRVPPAVSSLNIQADLEQLVEGIHLGGRWPQSRPGEIDQSIASAKFLEASAGMMNTAIRTYHQILQRMLERAIRISFEIDSKLIKRERTVVGILRNQEFLLPYDPKKDINTKHRVRVEYGLGLGRDPAQSAVLHIQYSQNEFVSKEFVQENIDGLTDVGRENIRMDLEKFRAMAFAKILQGVEAGSIPDRALVEIARAREKGEDVWEIFEKYIVEPQEEMAERAVPTGLGAPAQPGLPQPAQGGPPPGGPSPAAPQAPEGADLLARLNVPAGAGGTLGSQVLNEGG